MTSNIFDLSSRRILVTGANTGIGQAIAIGLAQAGAEVICAGRSPADETLQLIGEIGGKARQIACDFSDMGATRALVPQVWKNFGPVDGLLNNAGIIRREDSTDFSEKDWDDVLDVNLKSPWLLAQSFGKTAIENKRGGKMVNIASLLSFQGGIRVPSYTASKHGIEGLTKILCNEWATKDINVNAIAPGYIATNNTKALREDSERNAAILARIPANRWGDPSDLAGAAIFLMSDAAQYVNGTTITVDGGWMAR